MNAKTIATALFAAAALGGCATNSDGSTTVGMKGSPAWHDNAPRRDVEAYYDSMPVHELCIMWSDKKDRTDVRKEISNSLLRRKLNPLLCY